MDSRTQMGLNLINSMIPEDKPWMNYATRGDNFNNRIQSRFESGRYDPAIFSAFQKDFFQGLDGGKPQGTANIVHYADEVINKNAQKWLDKQYDDYVKQQQALQKALGGGGAPAPAKKPTNNLAPFMGGNGAMGNQAQLANQLSAFYGNWPNSYINDMNQTYGIDAKKLTPSATPPVQLSSFHQQRPPAFSYQPPSPQSMNALALQRQKGIFDV